MRTYRNWFYDYLVSTNPHIGWTSNPEYEKLGSHRGMDELRDRTIKVEVPYLQDWMKEKKLCGQQS